MTDSDFTLNDWRLRRRSLAVGCVRRKMSSQRISCFQTFSASWRFYGRMASCDGRNLFTCSARYDVSVNGLLRSDFSGESIKSLFERRTPPVYYSSPLATLELLILCVPSISADDINALLAVHKLVFKIELSSV